MYYFLPNSMWRRRLVCLTPPSWWPRWPYVLTIIKYQYVLAATIGRYGSSHKISHTVWYTLSHPLSKEKPWARDYLRICHSIRVYHRISGFCMNSVLLLLKFLIQNRTHTVISTCWTTNARNMLTYSKIAIKSGKIYLYNKQKWEKTSGIHAMPKAHPIPDKG